MIGGRLKSLRGKRTQEEIASHIGVSRARYSHYENGKDKKSDDDMFSDPDLQLAYRDMQDFSPESKQQAIEFINYLKEKEKNRKPKNK